MSESASVASVGWVGVKRKPTIPLRFWFPRAGVVTHSGRASVQSLSITRRWRVANAFPRRRVGTRITISL
jgi:hypothetical protein